MNLVIVQGRPTRDPYRGVSQKGVIFTKIRLAVDRPYTGKEKRTDYLNVICYGKLADRMGMYLAKGSLITVRGEMFQDEFIDAIGNKRESYYIKANQITIHEFLKKNKPLESLGQFDDIELIPREIAGALGKEIDFNDNDIPEEFSGGIGNDLF